LESKKCYDFLQSIVPMLKTGLVANLEDNQEVEASLEGEYVREDGAVRSVHLWHTPSTGSLGLEMTLAPHTPIILQGPRPGTPTSTPPASSQGAHPLAVQLGAATTSEGCVAAG
jgi:hypothetical protein